MSLEVELVLENKEEVEQFLGSLSKKLNVEIMAAFDRLAPSLERSLKATSEFRDRTGKLRRDLYCVTLYHPVGIIFGAYTPYAIYVALGHGTWRPMWFLEFIGEAVERVKGCLERLVERFCKENSSEVA